MTSKKKEWITPELISYGDIASITRGVAGWQGDGADGEYDKTPDCVFQS